MSLKRNLVSNYFGQAYTAVIGIVMLPVYVRFMGAEAYGLVGFFTMLQAWLLLLDLGLTPTLSRELSRVRAGVLSETRAATMLRSVEWFFAVLGILTAALVGIAADWIAHRWLKTDRLAADEVRLCLWCMGGVMATRWLVGLYRGALAGLERMVTLNAAGTVMATVRWVGVLGVFLAGVTRPSGFFLYQIGAAFAELAVLRVLFYRAFPMRGSGGRPSVESVRGLLGVAGSMAFLAGLWIVINQTDKLVLSWTIDLQRYGYYMVAVTLASGITLLGAPMGQALQPRFTMLAAQGAHAQLEQLYRLTTQATAAVVFAVGGVMAGFAEPLLQAWTGHAETAQASAPILRYYALGNAVAALLAVAFMLQFAYGKLRWHVIGNCLFAVVWFPCVIFAARRAGMIGVGVVWLGGNLAYLVGWLPGIHRRLVPGLWWRSLFQDVGLVAVAEAIVLALLFRLRTADLGRAGMLALVASIAAVAALAGLLAGSETRRALSRWIARKPALA
jgi:O-antigen/teichoic acid export membrane protein